RNRIEGRFLTALASVAFLAAALLVGQVMRRTAGGAARTLRVLQAGGLSRRHAILAGAAAPVAVAAAGSGAGVAAAAVVSRATPWGRSAASEPDPGVHVDGAVLSGVAFALVAALSAFALVAAYRETVPRSDPARRQTPQAGRLRLAGPVVVVTGLRFALQKAARSAVTPSWMAMATLAVGVVGIVATTTLWTALSETERNPERFGQTAQVVVSFEIAPDEDDEYRSAVLDELALAPEIGSVLNERIARADVSDLRFDVATYEPLGRDHREVFLAGSPPRRDDEIALGAASARTLDVAVGEQVTVTGFPGERRMTVSGIGLFTWDQGRYDQGGLVSPAAFDALFERPERHVGLVALRPGFAIEDVAERLGTFDGLPDSTVSYAATAIPADVLPNLRAMPLVLAAFIAVVTVGSAGGTAVVAVRRRRHEVAVLRALGLTRRQVRGSVLVQTSVIAAVGLAVGVPLGMLCGRVLWRATAGGPMPLDYRPPAQLGNVGVTAAVVILGLLAIAATASRRMIRGSVGSTLRTE
ncbi:MAG: ABC transporter permease, partial [Sporichthyaceae bacterium]